MSEERTAWGWGLASVDAAGTTLGEAFKLHPADGDSTTLIKDTQTIARTTISALWLTMRPTPVAFAACRYSSSASWTSRSVMPRTLT